MNEETQLIEHENKDKESSAFRQWREIVAVLVACIAPLSGGMAHGYSSPAIPELEKPIDDGGLNLSSSETSWFAACLTIGAVAGGPLASLILDRFGRKLSLMSSAFPFAMGWLLVVSANGVTIWLLYIGRVIIGIGIGMGSAVAPVYIAEVASPELRGQLGSFFQTCMVFGLLLTYVFGIGVHYVWLAVLSSIVACLLPLLLLIVPETPRWLATVGHHSEAQEAITWLRNYGNNTQKAKSDYDALIINMDTDSSQTFNLKEIWCMKGIRKAVLLSVILMMFQQLGGMNALAFYAEPLLLSAGFGKYFASIMSVILAAIMTVGTFASSFFLDKLGRKKMLIISGAVMCFSCASFAGYSLLTQNKIVNKSNWYMETLALLSLSLYVAGFSGGWGPVPWVVMSEILPNKARGMGCSIATTANWICAFIVVKSFRFLQNTISNTGTFFMFAGINLIAVFFALIFVPETKRKSLEEIEQEVCGPNDSLLPPKPSRNAHHLED